MCPHSNDSSQFDFPDPCIQYESPEGEYEYEYEYGSDAHKPPRSTKEIIRDKIWHVLDLFPTISPSMLQISLGSGITAAMWKPVLDKLVQEEEVYRYEKLSVSPGGRSQMVTCISSLPNPNPLTE